MSKFYVKDEDGKDYLVEELDADPVEEDLGEDKEKLQDEEFASLSQEELDALKRLASVADKLISMVNTTDAEEEVGESEEVIDTDEELEEDPAMKGHDSKKSFGSIEKKKVTNDSIDIQESIATAWAKRYGGK